MALLAVTAACGQSPTAVERADPTPTAQTSPTTSAVPRPLTEAAPCPYLDHGDVELTIGQKISRTEVTVTEPPSDPLPACAFFALNGDTALTVATQRHAGPDEALAAVVETVGDAGNPVDDLGDGGGVVVIGEQTVCAVSAGASTVTVTLNQAGSLETTEIAATVVQALGEAS